MAQEEALVSAIASISKGQASQGPQALTSGASASQVTNADPISNDPAAWNQVFAQNSIGALPPTSAAGSSAAPVSGTQLSPEVKAFYTVGPTDVVDPARVSGQLPGYLDPLNPKHPKGVLDTIDRIMESVGDPSNPVNLLKMQFLVEEYSVQNEFVQQVATKGANSVQTLINTNN